MTAEPVSDLEAARSEVNESEHEFTTASGVTYTFPRTPDWPSSAMRFLRQDRPEDAVALLLGEEALDDFAVRDINAFFEQVDRDEGLSKRGNSRGSSRSSRSTGLR